MTIIPCDWCGKLGHAWFQCSDKARPPSWKPDRLKRGASSTAARKDVPISGARVEAGVGLGELVKPSLSREDVGSIPAPLLPSAPKRGVGPTPIAHAAGTQAPPVDPKAEAAQSVERVPEKDEVGGSIPPLGTTTRGTPRIRAPKGTFDRKAYQREAAKKRRERKKAEKSK